jgi:glucose-1-phosphate thymidylyltransferase
MVDHQARILTAPVDGWYDCGKPETLIDTNHHLLSTTRGGVASGAVVESTILTDPVRIEEGVVLEGSAIGPNVTLEDGARVVNSSVRSCIVGPNAVIENSVLHESIVGGHAHIRSFEGKLSVADHSVVAP